MVDTEMKALDLFWGKEKPIWIFIEPLCPDECNQAESFSPSGLLGWGEAQAIILAK